MTLLHNMSAPPRTAVQLQGRPVTSRVTVYSLPLALIMADLVRVGAKGQGLTVNILDHAASTTTGDTLPSELWRLVGL